ncbi:MAG: hypothetical protein LBV69_06825 [Bacteroidales bacterium]|jgi:hypothetical protein|nr:hypothetical protein [Bacteroidales bacterium]
MKTFKTFFIFLIAVIAIIFAGCEEKVSNNNTNNDSVALKSTEINLIDIINDVLKKNKMDFRAESIISFGGEQYSQYEIQTIDYLDNFGKIRQYSFCKALYLAPSTNKANEVIKYQAFCFGDCDCKIEGIYDLNEGTYYNQCSCKDCSMVFLINFENKLTFGDHVFPFNIEKILPEIDENYKIGDIIKFTSIRQLQTDNDYCLFFVYFNETGNYSDSFAVSYANNNNTTYVINCTGTCDCRERFYPETKAIECTCNDCKMSITEIKAEVKPDPVDKN